MSFPRSSLRDRRFETARFQLISKRSSLVDSDGKQERPWNRELDFHVEHLKREERGGKRISRMLSFHHAVHKNQFTRHLAALKFNSPILSTLSRSLIHSSLIHSSQVFLYVCWNLENHLKIHLRCVVKSQRRNDHCEPVKNHWPLAAVCSITFAPRGNYLIEHRFWSTQSAQRLRNDVNETLKNDLRQLPSEIGNSLNFQFYIRDSDFWISKRKRPW